MNPVKAWAIVDSDGELVIWDYRLPLTWRRDLARADRNSYARPEDRVILVEIREVPKRKAKRK